MMGILGLRPHSFVNESVSCKDTAAGLGFGGSKGV